MLSLVSEGVRCVRLAEVVSHAGVVGQRDPQMLRDLTNVLVVPDSGVVIDTRDLVQPCLREVYFTRILGHRRVALTMRSSSVMPVISALHRLGWRDPPKTLKVVGDIRIRIHVDAVRSTPNGTEAVVINAGRYTKTAFLLGAITAALTGWCTYLISISPSLGRVDAVVKFSLNDAQRDTITNAVIAVARKLHNAFKTREPPPPEQGPWCMRCAYSNLCAALQRVMEVGARA